MLNYKVMFAFIEEGIVHIILHFQQLADGQCALSGCIWDDFDWEQAKIYVALGI